MKFFFKICCETLVMQGPTNVKFTSYECGKQIYKKVLKGLKGKLKCDVCLGCCWFMLFRVNAVCCFRSLVFLHVPPSPATLSAWDAPANFCLVAASFDEQTRRAGCRIEASRTNKQNPPTYHRTQQFESTGWKWWRFFSIGSAFFSSDTKLCKLFGDG